MLYFSKFLKLNHKYILVAFKSCPIHSVWQIKSLTLLWWQEHTNGGICCPWMTLVNAAGFFCK